MTEFRFSVHKATGLRSTWIQLQGGRKVVKKIRIDNEWELIKMHSCQFEILQKLKLLPIQNLSIFQTVNMAPFVRTKLNSLAH